MKLITITDLMPLPLAAQANIRGGTIDPLSSPSYEEKRRTTLKPKVNIEGP